MKIDHEKLWYTNNFLSISLLPLSWVFRIASTVRKRVQCAQGDQSNLNRPFVIVIGNITVGGTGKTPLIIWLALLCKAKGLKVGIVTRGYGRENTEESVEAFPTSSYKDVGDEAILISSKTACPVMVGKDRMKSVKRLADKYNVQVVLSDDGLQHYKLPRDVEIAVIDGERKFGNGRCLPAGPLREPISRLQDCDIVVTNGANELSVPSFNLDVQRVISISSDTISKSLKDFKNFTVHAVAGIGNPTRFFTLLKNAGIHILEHKFPDHHAYTEPDLEFGDNKPILMTEKDAVKCRKYTNKEIWYLPVDVIPNNEFSNQISKILEGFQNGKTTT